MRAGKGPAYEKWATIYNLKQMAAHQYLQENGLMEYAGLGRLPNKQFLSFGRRAKSQKYATVATVALLAV